MKLVMRATTGSWHSRGKRSKTSWDGRMPHHSPVPAGRPVCLSSFERNDLFPSRVLKPATDHYPNQVSCGVEEASRLETAACCDCSVGPQSLEMTSNPPQWQMKNQPLSSDQTWPHVHGCHSCAATRSGNNDSPWAQRGGTCTGLRPACAHVALASQASVVHSPCAPGVC